MGLTGLEQFIPEQGLQGIEVKPAITHKVQLLIRYFQILLIDTVHYQHILLSELQTTSLHETESHQLQTDDIIALHLQITRQRQLLGTDFYREFHLRSDKTSMLGIVANLLQELLLLHHYLGVRCLIDDRTLRTTACHHSNCHGCCCQLHDT